MGGGSSWLDAENVYLGKVLAASSDVQSYLHNHLQSVSFATFQPHYLFWLVLWYVLYVFLSVVLRRLELKGWFRVGKAEEAERENIRRSTSFQRPDELPPSPVAHRTTQTVFHMMNLLCSCLMLAVMIYVSTGAASLFDVMVTGSLTHTRDFAVRIDEWSSPLQVSQRVSNIAFYTGYAVVPQTVLYCVEVIALAASSIGLTSANVARTQWVIFFHHVVVLLLFCMGMSPVLECLDVGYLRMAWILSFHMALEQPCFLNILFYRLSRNRAAAKWSMGISIIYTLLLRVTVNALAFWCYLDLCWRRLKYNDWDLFWRWTFPPIILLLLVAQLYIVWVYYVLYSTKLKDVPIALDSLLGCKSSSTRSIPPHNKESGQVSRSLLSPSADEQVDAMILSPRHKDADGTSSEGAAFTLIGDDEETTTHLNHHPRSRSERLLSAALSSSERAIRSAKKLKPAIPYILVAIASLFLLATTLLFVWMPFTCKTRIVSKQKVAIVGGGASGMVTAWMLARQSPNFEVTLFEKSNKLGGAAHSAFVRSSRDNQVHGVDIGLVSFSEKYYNFVQLLKDLQVDKSEILEVGSGLWTATTDGNARKTDFFSTSGGLTASSDSSSSASVRELQLKLKILLDEAVETYTEEELMTTTLKTFLDKHDFPQEFATSFLRSCLGMYVGTSSGYLDTALAVLIFFERMFKGCTATDSSIPVKNFRNGTVTYVQRLAEELSQSGVRVRLNTSVDSISPGKYDRSRNAVTFNSQTEEEEFDHVVFAMRSDDLISLLDRSPQDFDALNIPRALYNRDKFMFRSFRSCAIGNTKDHSPLKMVNSLLTYDKKMPVRYENQSCEVLAMYNSIQPNPNDDHIGFIFPAFDNKQCYNDTNPFQPYVLYAMEMDAVLNKMSINGTKGTGNLDEAIHQTFNHTGHTLNFVLGGRNLHKAQGAHNIWYAGADFGVVNLHEFAVASGMVIASALGASYPYQSNALAKEGYLAMQYWMMFGVNPLAPRFSERSA